MTAYFIAIRKQLNDPASMDKYLAGVGKASEGHSLTPLAGYGRIRVTEGDEADGAVVLAFPTFEEAEAWYFSAAYQAVAPFRQNAGDYQTFIVQGMD